MCINDIATRLVLYFDTCILPCRGWLCIWLFLCLVATHIMHIVCLAHYPYFPALAPYQHLLAPVVLGNDFSFMSWLHLCICVSVFLVDHVFILPPWSKYRPNKNGKTKHFCPDICITQTLTLYVPILLESSIFLRTWHWTLYDDNLWCAIKHMSYLDLSKKNLLIHLTLMWYMEWKKLLKLSYGILFKQHACYACHPHH